MTGNSLERHVHSLLRGLGIEGAGTLHPIQGGGNNRAFRVDAGERRFFLKAYFQHPGDSRDRLGAEFGFSRFAWNHGLRALPEPLARDEENHLGLYEYIQGERLTPGAADAGRVREALDFFLEINHYRDTPDARQLPQASESCFSIDGHIDCVSRRVSRLQRIEDSRPLHRDAGAFAREELEPFWRSCVMHLRRQCEEESILSDMMLSPGDRCISPSDFGYHNALVHADGRLRFLDFEYAGWDDPAKTVCDFFCQVAVPVPMDFFELFSGTAATIASNPEKLRERIRRLLPIYRVKWCCILLNDFLPAGSARRGFADGAADREDREREQLQKAVSALQRARQQD